MRGMLAQSSRQNPMILAAGSNSKGQLANGGLDDSHTFQPCLFDGGTILDPSDQVLQIATGANHTFVLLQHNGINELWGCGDGTKGQLGPSYLQDVGTGTTSIFRRLKLEYEGLRLSRGTFESIIACWETSFILLRPDDGSSDILLSMGGNDFGDLGIGVAGKHLGIHIISFDHLLPDTTRKFHISALAAGPHHIIASLHISHANGQENDIPIGWGASRHGQLGLKLPPMGSYPSTQFLPTVISDIGADSIRSLSAGQRHTVIHFDTGGAQGYGSNAKGQLTGISDSKNARYIGCTWNGSYVVTETGSMFATGSNERGQLGHQVSESLGSIPLPTDLEFGGVACGSEHVLVHLGKEVWGWGWNEHGNLGLGHMEDVNSPTKVYSMTTRIKGIWAGCGTSWIVME